MERVKEYLVTWVIDILATSPQEAAEEALKIQRDTASDAVVFRVRSKYSNGYDVDNTIDLTSNKL